MKRIIGLVFFLIVLVFGLFFGLLNADPVPVDYYLGTREVPLSLVVVITLLFGALLGALAGLGLVLKMKRETSRLRKEIKVTEKELNNLRSIPLKDQR